MKCAPVAQEKNISIVAVNKKMNMRFQYFMGMTHFYQHTYPNDTFLPTHANTVVEESFDFSAAFCIKMYRSFGNVAD